ncbi:MAG: electron transport complex subunit RsxC [Bacteroidales bacterium]|nr:electron transport complex subunit RsxC [Bacteroidales bacterium]
MLKTFTLGGVHPPENKLSAKEIIKELDIPENVTVPLAMHLGVPAKPVVEKGYPVKTGQLIAKGDGFVSANIHSPVSGKVLKIDKALDVSGYKKDAIFINTEGDEWIETIDRSAEIIKDFNLSPEEIVNKINDAGIVGLGGATFPSHVKLSVPRGKKAEYLLINGVECEPYLTSDHAVMLERSEELMVGISILKKALKVNKAFIGIEVNKPDAIEKLSNIAQEFKGISVQPLEVKYPQGGEKQLIKAVLSREVPSGGLPIDVGVVVFNVGTSLAVYEAIQKNKPLFERVVTVTGKSLQKPSNFKVRIGTPLIKLIEAAGGLPEDTGKIINGGPMMGKALSSAEVPVIKGSSGILILKREESARKEVGPCIRCTMCVKVCPMGLEPYLLMTMSEKALYESLEKEKIMDCIECGSCSYICPANRPMLDYIRLGKNQVGKIIRERKK